MSQLNFVGFSRIIWNNLLVGIFVAKITEGVQLPRETQRAPESFLLMRFIQKGNAREGMLAAQGRKTITDLGPYLLIKTKRTGGHPNSLDWGEDEKADFLHC